MMATRNCPDSRELGSDTWPVHKAPPGGGVGLSAVTPLSSLISPSDAAASQPHQVRRALVARSGGSPNWEEKSRGDPGPQNGHGRPCPRPRAAQDSIR